MIEVACALLGFLGGFVLPHVVIIALWEWSDHRANKRYEALFKQHGG